MGKGVIEVRSAGIEAHGLHPRAVEVMKEVGVDISTQRSQVVTPDMLAWVDRVITLCGHADETCPALPPGTERRHWPIEDPARAQGSEEQVMEVFRRVRDDIRRRVEALIEEIKA
ncbi:MAG: arsenate reductase ArsC [Gammaproteobacteria bacterium]|nr:MAG: arsenate reductase ArsC [Gammaproteobacteria bacterium]